MNEPDDDLAPIPTDQLLAQALGASRVDPDGESTERWALVQELRQRATPEVFDAAAGWCVDDQASTRALGADVLGQLGHTEETESSPFAERSLPLLLEMLGDADASVLQSTIVALGHLAAWGVAWDWERLREHASHGEAEVRQAVAFALGGTPCESAGAAGLMLGLMEDAEAWVRDWATFGLGVQTDVDTPAVREALASRLADVDDEVRCEALLGLARRKDARAISLIEAELAQDEVSAFAVEAAGEFGRPEFAPPLRELAKANPEDEDIAEALASCESDETRNPEGE